ncbi:AAA family ATPase [Agrobacterium tumefaciens]|uniref:ATP-dependent nuclease n=1 Tax=Agrobacterium tumefaciens TaxID=358 RepID=UPI0015720386|nr:AAA family ATPase [Agrobacterium tumefaciens]NSZ69156.1 AAA family ATPase [Agrobacterium tumefaciens]
MIREIRLTNFRKFEKYTVLCRQGNIFVGPNNAGKSALIEAMRILDACIRLSIRKNPKLVSLPDGNILYGYEISRELINVDLSHSSHNYVDLHSAIEFKIDNGNKAIIIIEREGPVLFTLESESNRTSSANKFHSSFPLNIVVVPTLSTLEREEKYVLDETIQKSYWKKTSSRHFRNVWLRKSEAEFLEFAHDVNSAWPNIILQKPERQRGDQSILEMFYSEQRFDREITWSGFGFQVWVQMLTHLGRAKNAGIVVIDEPDIYLHSDLQKKLIKILRERYSQFFLATHSTEIIDEAEEMEIVSVNSQYKTAKRIKSEEDYNKLRQYVGSSINYDIARVSKAKKVIFVEGEDRRVIEDFAKILGLKNLVLNAVPFVKLGGFFGWERALGAVWAFKEILDMDIEAYCLFDRDYRSADEIEEFRKKMEHNNVRCRVLGRKEIENYLIDLDAIYLAVSNKTVRKNVSLNRENFDEIVERVMLRLKSKVFSQISAKKLEFSKKSRSKLDIATVFQDAHEDLEKSWSDINERVKMIPGKQFFSDLNSYFQQNELPSITYSAVLRCVRVEDLDRDFIKVLQEIDEFCEK